MLAILLTCYVTATPVPITTTDVLDRVRQDHPELFSAPTTPPWPQGLPVPLATPLEARCYDRGGNELGAGAWLPRERSDVVAQRLVMLETYPARCQAAIDALVTAIGGKSICAVAGDGVADMAVTEAETPPPGHSTWTVARWATYGAIGGLVAGVLMTLAATR